MSKTVLKLYSKDVDTEEDACSIVEDMIVESAMSLHLLKPTGGYAVYIIDVFSDASMVATPRNDTVLWEQADDFHSYNRRIITEARGFHTALELIEAGQRLYHLERINKNKELIFFNVFARMCEEIGISLTTGELENLSTEDWNCSEDMMAALDEL